MSEKPIERLNYFNGQRLEADDLRLEQAYHMRIQRWLSKSLFSPGVADGFDVSAVEDPDTKKKDKVLVAPGLALDDLGRAIILINPVELSPQARFLCVRYAEHKGRVQEGECTVRGASPGALARWGGPERIVSDVDFTWRAGLPQQDKELVIAELELNPDCTIARVATGAKKVAAATQVSRVYSYALEGEKDIDSRNAKKIHFHIRGRRPEAVTLYLRASKFSTLFYSEIGRHGHAAKINGQSSSEVEVKTGTSLDRETGKLAWSPQHKHSLTDVTTMNESEGPEQHKHSLDVEFSRSNPPSPVSEPLEFVEWVAGKLEKQKKRMIVLGDKFEFKFLMIDYENWHKGNVLDTVGGSIGGGQHSHGFASDAETGQDETSYDHIHKVSLATTLDETGAEDEMARPTQKALKYLKNLRVAINGRDVTDKIRAQLKETNPNAWGLVNSLDGSPADPLGADGTGPIRLDLIDGLSFDRNEKPYEIELFVKDEGTGGCIQYNLYVE